MDPKHNLKNVNPKVCFGDETVVKQLLKDFVIYINKTIIQSKTNQSRKLRTYKNPASQQIQNRNNN